MKKIVILATAIIFLFCSCSNKVQNEKMAVVLMKDGTVKFLNIETYLQKGDKVTVAKKKKTSNTKPSEMVWHVEDGILVKGDSVLTGVIQKVFSLSEEKMPEEIVVMLPSGEKTSIMGVPGLRVGHKIWVYYNPESHWFKWWVDEGKDNKSQKAIATVL